MKPDWISDRRPTKADGKVLVSGDCGPYVEDWNWVGTRKWARLKTKMHAGIEPIAGIIRVWEEGRKYGDPYEWCASVRYITKDTIEIAAYTKKVTPSIWRAIRDEMQRLGIKKVLSVTYENGARREKWLTVPTKAQEFYRSENNG